MYSQPNPNPPPQPVPYVERLNSFGVTQHTFTFSESNQQGATFLNLFISVRRSTHFRWVFHPSSGAQNCTYLLTYSMVQSPSWEANWFAASQEIHYRTQKRPPPVSILGQPNPVHIPTPHLLEIHPNIIHPSTPRSPQWSLSLQFPHQNPLQPPLLTHTRHVPSPSHSSRFYHPHNIGWGVQIM